MVSTVTGKRLGNYTGVYDNGVLTVGQATLTVTAATVASQAGTYAIDPTVTGATLGNYTVVYDNGVLTVGQATLTVTAASASRAYRLAEPASTGAVSGALNGDTFTVSGSSPATP